MDMDGVLVHETEALPGADRFLARLRERELPFLVLSGATTREEADRFPCRPSRIVDSVARAAAGV